MWVITGRCAGLPPVSSARYEYDYEARAGSYWRIMRGGGPVRQNYGYDGWLGWPGCSVCSALLCSRLTESLHYRVPVWGAQCRCAGLSQPLCGLESRSPLLAWSLSLSHYIIAMIWDQCAGRLYTRTLPISVHTVPYDSCKLLYTKLLLS